VAITMDWTATFRRLAGLGRDPKGEDGIDLMPVLAREEPERERTLFWRRKKGPVRKSVEEGRAVRHGHWKLVEQTESGEQMLFNLKTDRGESINLAKDHPNLVKQLIGRLDAWEESVASTFPVDNVRE
jgi:arylsulfatase A-like enzyme